MSARWHNVWRRSDHRNESLTLTEIPTKAREMLASLIGMLGSEHDGECLNAARLLKRRMEKEKISFGDLSNIIRNGGGNVTRTVIVEKRPAPNPAAKTAQAILDRAGVAISFAEMEFLRDIVHSAVMTGGNFNLSTRQANWLGVLRKQYLTGKTRFYKAAKPRKDKTYDQMCDEMGL